MRDDVTVIITTFDGQREFVERAIASAKGQAHVLVVDDHNTPADHSYAAWWEGVYRARTPYVCLLHSDDWYEPTFVERCRERLTDETAWVATDAVIHFSDGHMQLNLGVLRDYNATAEMATELLMEHVLSPSCVMMRREDALQSILPGGVPGVTRRSVVSGPDLLYTLLPIWSRNCVLLRDPLVNFTAHAGSATIAAFADPVKTQELADNYKEARRFARAVASCL